MTQRSAVQTRPPATMNATAEMQWACLQDLCFDADRGFPQARLSVRAAKRTRVLFSYAYE
jgi:hypothetical protein